jgi:hypothetical protein
MKRIHILCEGQTEYDFVDKVLRPYFMEQAILLIAHNLKGGFSYQKLKHTIIEWLNYDKSAYVTTMIDLYGMNNRYPQYAEMTQSERPALEKVVTIEAAIREDVLNRLHLHNYNFIPYVQLHEFEALLFSEPKTLEAWIALSHRIPNDCFSTIRNAFDTPEDINDSPHTAPSKRILNIAASYDKVAEGVTIASDIGVQKMRAVCPHFNAWLTQLENVEAQ